MDCWPNFQTLTFREFSFSVERYQEYVGGCIVASGYVDCSIHFKQHNNGDYHKGGIITVRIQDNPLEDRLLSTFEFDTCVTMGDRLMMYICAERTNVNDTSLLLMKAILGPTRQQKNYEPKEPTVVNVFTTNQQIVRVAFKLVNPDRLIEFY